MQTIETIFTAALSKMREFSIPLTPQNYALWYEYCKGARQDIKARIDEIILSDVAFSPAVSETIHRHCFEDNSRLLLKTSSDHINRLIRQIRAEIVKSDDPEGGLETVTSLFNDPLRIDDDLNVLQAMVCILIEASRNSRRSMSTANESVQSMSLLIESLRVEVDQLSEAAYTDFLTGISNRRAFDEKYEQMHIHARKMNKSFSLLLLDIDHFKKFNDDFGHAIGDSILRNVARTLVSSIKGRDMAARYGGEEFAILLPDTCHEGAVSLANIIIAAIAAKRLRVGKDKRLVSNITVSIGVASFQKGDALDDMLVRADHCLYTAKHLGRNRSVNDQSILQ